MKLFKLFLTALICSLSIQAESSENIVGILQIPSIFPNYLDSSLSGEPTTDQLSDRRFNIREEPSLGSRVLAIASDSDPILSAEFGYEQSGALVYDTAHAPSSTAGVSDFWYKIFLVDLQKYGWINLHSEMTMHSLKGLLKDGIVSIDILWDGQLLDSLGGDALRIDVSSHRERTELDRNYRVSEDLGDLPSYREMAATVVQFDTWEDDEWMLVIIFEESGCITFPRQPRIIATGWIRLYSDINRTNAWFSSRGC